MILDGIVFKEIVAKTQKEYTYLQRMLMSAKVFELLNFDFNIFEKWMGSATFKPNITGIAHAILTLGKRVQFCKPNLVKFFSFFLNEVYSILLLENFHSIETFWQKAQSMVSFWCLYCQLWTYFTLCSTVSIVTFK